MTTRAEGYGRVRDRAHPPWAVTRGEMARLLGFKDEQTIRKLYQRLGIVEQPLRLPPLPGHRRVKYPVIPWKTAKMVYQTIKLRRVWEGPTHLQRLGEPRPFPWDPSPGDPEKP